MDRPYWVVYGIQEASLSLQIIAYPHENPIYEKRYTQIHRQKLTNLRIQLYFLKARLVYMGRMERYVFILSLRNGTFSLKIIYCFSSTFHCHWKERVSFAHYFHLLCIMDSAGTF